MIAAATSTFRKGLAGIGGLSGLPRELSAGLVASLSALTNCFAFGALIFSGPLHIFLSQGIAASLLTCAVTAVIIALTSRFPIAIGAPTAGISALLAVLMASLAPAMSSLPPPQMLALAYAALFTATAAVAVTLLLLGFIRAGKLVRFVPYPVIAGFMGATGWLVMAGAVKMSTDVSLGLAGLTQFAQPREGRLLAILLVWTAVLWVLTKKVKHPLTLPVALVVASLATYLALPFLGISGEAAHKQGFLFSVTDTSWPGISALNGAYLQADWRLILVSAGAIGAIGAVVVIAVLQTLSLATGLEMTTRIEADLDHELRSMGWANVATAALGGYVGQVALSATTVNRAAGGTSRLTGVVVSLVALLAMLGAGTALEYIPRFVLGGALLMQGLRLVQEWAVATYRTLPRLEWLLIVAMIVITAWFGFVTAEVVALLAACVLFALSVSRAGVVRAISGLNARTSTLVRPEAEMLLLAEHGSAVQIIDLRGFVFFGSTHELRETVKALLAEHKPLMLIFDFNKVIGIDSSAATAMVGISRLLRDRNVQTRIVGLSPAVSSICRSAGFAEDVVALANIDAALEQGEDMVIVRHASGSSEHVSFPDWMSSLLDGAQNVTTLRQYLVSTPYQSGTYLCRQGDPTNDLYLIETGRLSALVQSDSGAPIRLRAFGANTLVGEIAFVLNVPRTASLRVDEDAIVWSLSRSAYSDLLAAHPGLMVVLMQSMLRLQVERLSFATRRIADLQA